MKQHHLTILLPIVAVVLSCGVAVRLLADEPFALNRCEIIPLAEQQVSLKFDGVEKTRWRFGINYPRPFFYPFRGPSGASLTRMGHPGAPNHDHHRSIWFAHHNVDGVDFWSDRTDARIRQKFWYSYGDGNDEGVMAVRLGWFDGKGKELMDQDVVAALLPLTLPSPLRREGRVRGGGEHALELQITMRPGKNSKSVMLGKTSFGFLAVRVAKTLSVHFGGGKLTSSEGRKGEKAIFGKQARWMDYSGSVAVGQGRGRKGMIEGITYFDHPANPRYPTHWHVRSDGWMGASFCMRDGFQIKANAPLTLRYLLHAHRGGYDAAKAKSMHERFAKRPGFAIRRATQPHVQYEVQRAALK